jgi:DNA-binding IclR family transcriptional regulator
MDARQRQLLELLSSDSTQEILRQLKAGRRTNSELTRATTLGRSSVDRSLVLLLAYGLVDSEAVRRTTPGRSSLRWRIRNKQRLRRFEQAARQTLPPLD